VNNELEEMWMEDVAALLRYVPDISLEGAYENHKIVFSV
jgi:hypothetical protein